MSDPIMAAPNLHAALSPADVHALSDADLHDVYGGGTYPRAVGCKITILFPVSTIEGCPAISYFDPWPGSFENGERFALAKTCDDAANILIQGCKEDGLIETTKLDARKGFNIVALFYSSGSEYFFARYADQKWILKRPMYAEQTFTAPEDITKETQQELVSYFYAPENTRPKCLSSLQYNDLSIRAKDGKEALIKEIVAPANGTFNIIPSTWFKLDAQNKEMVLYDTERFERAITPLPMPAWNLPAATRPVIGETLRPRLLALDGYA